MHCAALIVVPESVTDPLRYSGTPTSPRPSRWSTTCSATAATGCCSAPPRRCTAPGTTSPSTRPRRSNPPARTRGPRRSWRGCCATSPDATQLRTLSLRYFNPIGADPALRSGLQIRRRSHVLGQAHRGRRGPAAVHRSPGSTRPTRDGTGIRDYIHVWDLAAGARRRARRSSTRWSPRQLRSAQSRHRHRHHGAGDGRRVPAGDRGAAAGSRGGPRPGDVAGAYTRSDRARQVLDWRPVHSMADGIRDSLRWSEIRDSASRNAEQRT